MLIVRATRKLLRLAGPPTAAADEQSSTLLGTWYATVLFWKPRVVLLVNESTLLPVLMPLAPYPDKRVRGGREPRLEGCRRLPETSAFGSRWLLAQRRRR